MSASLAISEELIAPGRPNRPGTKINPTYITIHNTANSNEGADADAHSRFVRNKGYYDWKGNGPPPLKWSALKYGLMSQGGRIDVEEAQA